MDKQAKSGIPVKNTNRKRQLSTSSNDSESRKSRKKPKLEAPPKPAKKQTAQKNEKTLPNDISKQSKYFKGKSPAPAKPAPKSKASPSPKKLEQSNVTKRKSMVQDFKSEEKKAGHRASKAAQPKTSENAGLPLAGMTYVISGVIDNYTRDELTDLLKSFGARVTGSVSSKTSCWIN